ncbi:MAG: hypothetical protein JWL95_1634 [Gemmatimonadetes bacterium]|nr:hypothetical protein [Gemmatimonadota bacterium]
MIPEVVVFAQVATIVVVLVGSLATVGWTIYRKAHLLKTMGPLPRHTDAQLEQLQQSVDAIAVEVERIAESQRFSAKLLVERADSQPDASRGR